MAYSAEGYLTAQQLVMSFLLPQIERTRPGSVRTSLDAVAKHLSSQLEADPDQPALKDALYIVGQWSDVLPTAASESSLSDQTTTAPSGIDLQPWLHDKDAMPATLEGQALARLSFHMLISALWKLDEKFEGLGLAPHVLNEATVFAGQGNQEMGGSNPVYQEMLRIMGASHREWQQRWDQAHGKTEG